MKRLLLAILLTITAVVMFPSISHAEETCHILVSNNVVTAVGCPEGSHIATYKFKDGIFPGEENFDASQPQTLFDSGSNSAKLPLCAWQADIFTGSVLDVIDRQHRYDTRLLAYSFGGNVPCGEVAATIASTTSTTSTTTTLPVTTDIPTTQVSTPSTLPSTGSQGNLLGMSGVALMLFGLGAIAIVKSSEIKSQLNR